MKKNVLITVLLIVVASLIYYLSSMPYEKQSLIPYLEKYQPHEWIEKNLSWVEVNYAGSVINVESYGSAYFVEFFIRKAAHLGIFATLAVMLFLFLNKWFKKKVALPIAFSCTVLYAVLDELHQKKTGGRSPMWQDVVLDSVGALIALSVVALIILKKRKKRGKKDGIQ